MNSNETHQHSLPIYKKKLKCNVVCFFLKRCTNLENTVDSKWMKETLLSCWMFPTKRKRRCRVQLTYVRPQRTTRRIRQWNGRWLKLWFGGRGAIDRKKGCQHPLDMSFRCSCRRGQLGWLGLDTFCGGMGSYFEIIKFVIFWSCRNCLRRRLN